MPMVEQMIRYSCHGSLGTGMSVGSIVTTSSGARLLHEARPDAVERENLYSSDSIESKDKHFYECHYEGQIWGRMGRLAIK